ncbi:hypothetical protein HMPREF9714_03310 [Myroides odoratimimus CCUG 12901]|uniref:Uncharacterized protein n=2 Tax=Myroides odoratimimus TaxID=76832 RepID=A0AAI8C369_9FLAO|nr:hypothetical protein [Myroides odoratimimus]ALU25242.1 hypothetical protein AS202_03315 [Myroides odoratimimus]EHO05372.1 hypothetical protein HMPREF9714_03310 [Myroides odoratimimus CCUG 12901]
MGMKQESKSYKAVTMNLVQAVEADRYKFRNAGFMYFVYYPHKEEFEPYPKFTYKGMNVQEFNELFYMGMIYIPQGILDLLYLERQYYEKQEI